jgi:hypothetical protein
METPTGAGEQNTRAGEIQDFFYEIIKAEGVERGNKLYIIPLNILKCRSGNRGLAELCKENMAFPYVLTVCSLLTNYLRDCRVKIFSIAVNVSISSLFPEGAHVTH